MIAIDTSILVAIAHCEPGYRHYEAFLATEDFIIGPSVLLEAHMVLRGRKTVDPVLFMSTILSLPSGRAVPIDERHVMSARDAFDRFGKGQGHPAQLNFGDCLSYAMAKVAGVPLLFTGDDFRHTDIKPATST